ncbi:MAG: hypothetical protein JNK03_10060 [Nitrospira sp.]|nr:hypothetical protein [Nitrospira sp.]
MNTSAAIADPLLRQADGLWARNSAPPGSVRRSHDRAWRFLVESPRIMRASASESETLKSVARNLVSV